MIRTLLIVFFLGLAVTVAGFTGSAALGGPDRSPDGFFRKVRFGHGSFSEGPVNRRHEPAGPRATRNLPWTGGEKLTINSVADVIYIQSAESGVTITGPKNWIDRVKVEDGEISILDGPVKVTQGVSAKFDLGGSKTEWQTSHSDVIQITVKAPNVRRFELNGAPSLVIKDYKQDDLEIDVQGTADIKVGGEAIRLNVEMDGAGKGEFRDLTLREARIELNGAGDVTAGPTLRADLEINGVGRIRLLNRPPELKQTLHGLGSVTIEDPAKPTTSSKSKKRASTS